MRVPLTERREALESLPWVEQAHVQRVMPNRIRVEITERTPVAFLRTGSDLSLVDAHGVILDRPVEGEFRFPVVAGIGEPTPRATREQHMNLYVQFMKEIERAQPGAADHVSEADISEISDLRATLTGVGTASGSASPILVHFGDSDFGNRYHLLAENIDQVASQRRERRFGGFAVRAASGGESGIEDHRGQCEAERAAGRTPAWAAASAPARDGAARKRR